MNRILKYIGITLLAIVLMFFIIREVVWVVNPQLIEREFTSLEGMEPSQIKRVYSDEDYVYLVIEDCNSNISSHDIFVKISKIGFNGAIRKLKLIDGVKSSDEASLLTTPLPSNPVEAIPTIKTIRDMTDRELQEEIELCNDRKRDIIDEGLRRNK